jgi:phenylacetate-CoA ligase
MGLTELLVATIVAHKKYAMWDEKVESMPGDELRELQLERLQRTVRRVYDHVTYYGERCQQVGVKPEDLQTLQDLAKFPFTTKQDLRDNYPFGAFAVPLSEVSEIHATSGTTGKMTVTGYTKSDLKVWSQLMARVYTVAGVGKGDVIHNCLGYGLFTGGFGFHHGGIEVGATVVPVSSGETQRQLMILQDFGCTVLVATPSYAMALAEEAAKAGLDPKKDLKLRVGLLGAEPWSEAMRRQIEEGLNLEAFDSYGLAEVIGPGVALECSEHDGMHIAEDHFYPEIIDPDTGQPQPYGTMGELVFTTLTKEAFPLVRYRTRDRTVLKGEKCFCGRTMVRMGKVLGRTDGMLTIRGVNVFPSQIEHVLLGFKELALQYVIYVDRPRDLDVLTVEVEAASDLHQQGAEARQRVEEKVSKALSETLYVSARVKVREPPAIQRSEGKARRVVDRRKFQPGRLVLSARSERW